MVVTVADVATQMGGVRNATTDGYLFFRYYEIYDTTIQEYIDQCTAWMGAQIDTAVQTANPALYDWLIQNYTCYRLAAEQIMQMIMETGFSYESLELRVDRKNYPDVLMNAVDQYVARTREFFDLLRNRVEIFSYTELNVDPFGVWEDDFRGTAAWKRGA